VQAQMSKVRKPLLAWENLRIYVFFNKLTPTALYAIKELEYIAVLLQVRAFRAMDYHFHLDHS
jgi:hypothetical protein